MQQNFSLDNDFESGYVLCVDKPYGWGSADVIRRISYFFKKRGLKKLKVGHAGTLDPLATGVLLVCLGKATKQAESLQAQPKEYITEVTLGATTPGFDNEHEIDAHYPTSHITRKMVEKALSEFVGEQEQMPPGYSAKSIDGKRAYELAREGKEINLKPSLVNIYEVELLECALPVVRVRIACSKGTYIRSFARDLGEKLQSGGYLTSLERTRSGDYRIEDAVSMQNIIDTLKTDDYIDNGDLSTPLSRKLQERLSAREQKS